MVAGLGACKFEAWGGLLRRNPKPAAPHPGPARLLDLDLLLEDMSRLGLHMSEPLLYAYAARVTQLVAGGYSC